MVKSSLHRLIIGALAIVLVAGFLLVDSSAQKKKRKRKPANTNTQITNPDIYQAPPADNSNANTSEEGANTNSSNTNASGNSRPSSDQDPEAMKKTIRSLSNQVDKLSEKISQMEESQRSLVDLERLSRAEQRSTQLRAELRDLQQKDSDLSARLEEIDFQLRPENIERATQGYGTTRPEDLREQRRRQLESEKQRIQRQLDQFKASEASLEQAIATSDAEVDRLRKKLDAADQAAIDAKSQSDSGQTNPTPTPTPSPFQ